MTSLTSCTGWGGVGWGINVLCSKNFQLRRWLPTTLASNYVAIFSTNLASTLASLVRNLSSTLLSSLSTSNYVSDVSDWQNLGTDVTKPWRKKKRPLSCAKTMAPLSFVKWSTKSWVLFWGWNVHIWWPVHRKRIKPMELRRKPDKKTWNSLQNAKRHRIHKRQKGNAATFKYPPSGMIIDDYRWL